jgi:hypothetical protein
MVGGTFGVAAMGALITGLGRHKLDESLPQLPAGTREKLADGLGAGGGAAESAGAQVHDAVTQAFLYALNDSLRLAAVVSALGALLAWLLIEPGAPQAQSTDEAEVAATAEAIAA